MKKKKLLIKNNYEQKKLLSLILFSLLLGGLLAYQLYSGYKLVSRNGRRAPAFATGRADGGDDSLVDVALPDYLQSTATAAVPVRRFSTAAYMAPYAAALTGYSMITATECQLVYGLVRSLHPASVALLMSSDQEQPGLVSQCLVPAALLAAQDTRDSPNVHVHVFGSSSAATISSSTSGSGPPNALDQVYGNGRAPAVALVHAATAGSKKSNNLTSLLHQFQCDILIVGDHNAAAAVSVDPLAVPCATLVLPTSALASAFFKRPQRVDYGSISVIELAAAAATDDGNERWQAAIVHRSPFHVNLGSQLASVVYCVLVYDETDAIHMETHAARAAAAADAYTDVDPVSLLPLRLVFVVNESLERCSNSQQERGHDVVCVEHGSESRDQWESRAVNRVLVAKSLVASWFLVVRASAGQPSVNLLTDAVSLAQPPSTHSVWVSGRCQYTMFRPSDYWSLTEQVAVRRRLSPDVAGTGGRPLMSAWSEISSHVDKHYTSIRPADRPFCDVANEQIRRFDGFQAVQSLQPELTKPIHRPVVAVTGDRGSSLFADVL